MDLENGGNSKAPQPYKAFLGRNIMTKLARVTGYVVCVRNDDAEDLHLRMVYRTLPDDTALSDGYLRVVDDSGEDYLYPAEYFVPVSLPRSAEQALFAPQST